jgi:epoxide hydrolase-like predicted phosphatase
MNQPQAYKAIIFDYHGVLLRHFRLQKPLYEYAERLRDQGFITAVLSNMYSPVAWLVKTRGDLNPFETQVISCDVGTAKPQPEIYQIMLAKLGLKAEECIFIDNLRRNIKGAEAVGIKSIRAVTTKQVINDVEKLLSNQTEPPHTSK